jgi:hypothetical protein
MDDQDPARLQNEKDLADLRASLYGPLQGSFEHCIMEVEYGLLDRPEFQDELAKFIAFMRQAFEQWEQAG